MQSWAFADLRFFSKKNGREQGVSQRSVWPGSSSILIFALKYATKTAEPKFTFLNLAQLWLCAALINPFLPTGQFFCPQINYFN